MSLVVPAIRKQRDRGLDAVLPDLHGSSGIRRYRDRIGTCEERTSDLHRSICGVRNAYIGLSLEKRIEGAGRDEKG